MTSGFPYPLSHLERFKEAETTADLAGHLIGPHGFDEPVKDASWSQLLKFHEFDHERGCPHAVY